MEARKVIRKIDINNKEDYDKVIKLRRLISLDFVGNEEEFFSYDKVSDIYLMELANGEPLGTVTITAEALGFRFSSIAVSDKYQNSGLASYMIKNLFAAHLPKLKPGQFFYTISKLHLVDFYKSFGGETLGNPFIRWGRPHQIVKSTFQDYVRL